MSLQSTYFSHQGRQSRARPDRHALKVHSCAKPEEESRRTTPIPGGLWLHRKYHDRDVVYGSTFIIQREKVGGPGLVLSKHKDATIQVWAPPSHSKVLVKSGQIATPGSLVPFALPPEIVVSDAVVDVDTFRRRGSAQEGNVGETGLVFVGDGSTQKEEEASGSSSPRRTSKMRFTCDRCKTVNVKFVNPLAWEHGAVFCRCDGCQVVHLVQDKAGWFANLKGPLFPKITPNSRIKIPPGLPQNPKMPPRRKYQ